MVSEFSTYEHHDRSVWVRTALRGKHREHCLCRSCDRFAPEYRDENCPIANLVYSVCVAADLVLPVWECPNFLEKQEGS